MRLWPFNRAFESKTMTFLVRLPSGERLREDEFVSIRLLRNLNGEAAVLMRIDTESVGVIEIEIKSMADAMEFADDISEIINSRDRGPKIKDVPQEGRWDDDDKDDGWTESD